MGKYILFAIKVLDFQMIQAQGIKLIANICFRNLGPEMEAPSIHFPISLQKDRAWNERTRIFGQLVRAFKFQI